MSKRQCARVEVRCTEDDGRQTVTVWEDAEITETTVQAAQVSRLARPRDETPVVFRSMTVGGSIVYQGRTR